MANAARRFGVLAIGVAAIVAGVLVYQFPPAVVTYDGSYTPLSDTAFVAPFPYLTPSIVGAALLILLGAVLVAGWVGFVAGRRRSPRPSSPITDSTT